METGLALAGGGIPGCTAIGVIRALNEAGITISHIAGTSSGSMIAALHAFGYSPSELEEIVPTLNRRHLDLDWRAILKKALFLNRDFEGLLKGNRLKGLMDELTEGKSLSSLRTPCGIVATDMDQERIFVFSNTHVKGYDWDDQALIGEAVRASFAIPLLFQPMHYKGRTLYDGGILVNCPVQVCKAMGAKHVIAVDPISPMKTADRPVGLSTLLHQVIYFHLKTQMKAEHSFADFVLYPESPFVSALDFQKAADFIDLGYKAAMKQMEEIKQVLEESNHKLQGLTINDASSCAGCDRRQTDCEE
ncbi:patatin-like phospholipase family protein [Peribacillus sp. SCS-155]|uniref:patatin-like phospholipase family protein n=1 Tax=Peribacillus sedimenti TaxID=3115297 RepID=UPI0039065009